MQLLYILGTDFAKLLDQQQQMINILSTLMQYNMQRTPNNYICHQSSSSQQYDTFQNETDQQQLMSQHSPSFNPQENLPLPQSATSQAIYYYCTYVVIVFSIPCIPSGAGYLFLTARTTHDGITRLLLRPVLPICHIVHCRYAAFL